MKKLKFILAFAMLFGCIATIGAATTSNEVTKVEAATSSFSVVFKTHPELTQDPSAAFTSDTDLGNQVQSGKEYVTFSSGSYVYGGLKGLKFSSSKKNGTLTLKLNQAYNVSSIVVSAAKWKSSEAAKIAINSATAVSLTDSFADYSFTIGDTIETFSIKATKRVYLQSLTINYETSASEQYAFTFDANGGTIDGAETKTIEVNDGYEVAMPAPVNPGYRFLGWFTAAEGGEKVESLVSSSETDGTTLYAHWEVIVEPEVLTKTVAEVIELPASTEQLYSVRGVVSNITNTTYGNFDLIDGESSIYVYGATTKADALVFDNNTGNYIFNNPKDFASAGLEEGDIITLKCFRLDFNTKKELNGVITSIEKPLPPEPTLEEKLAEFTTNASVGFSYTKSGEDYTFSNVRLSFRGTISAELYEEVVAAGVTAAGIECSIEGEEPYTIDCSANIGTDAEGNKYVFGSLLVPEGKENIEVTAKAFVTVDGARLYLASTSHSLVSAVSAYLGGAVELTEEQLAAVTALAASLGIIMHN